MSAAGGLSWETPTETWEWVLGVNLWGVIHGIRAFVPILMQQAAGHVVNTASIAGLVAGPFMGPYNASKHAVVALSETLHHELAMAAAHVNVSVLCPGWVNTRIGESERNRPDQGEGADAGAGLSLLQDVLGPGHGARGGRRPRCSPRSGPSASGSSPTTTRRRPGWTAVNRRAQSLIDRTDPAFGVPL